MNECESQRNTVYVQTISVRVAVAKEDIVCNVLETIRGIEE